MAARASNAPSAEVKLFYAKWESLSVRSNKRSRIYFWKYFFIVLFWVNTIQDLKTFMQYTKVRDVL